MHLITRKCDLSTSADRFWLIEQIRDKEGLAFQAEDLVSTVKFISSTNLLRNRLKLVNHFAECYAIAFLRIALNLLL